MLFRSFKVFWLFPLPAIVAPSDVLAEQAGRMHLVQVLLLTALLIGHIAAALRHHYARRNGVLLRMLTGKDVRS